MLGFFFGIKEAGLNETLYYNDISANNGVKNLGHSTHKTGKDIDIRYPGSTNASGEQLWTVAKTYWGSEAKLILKMGEIYDEAKKWNFTKNYQW